MYVQITTKLRGNITNFCGVVVNVSFVHDPLSEAELFSSVLGGK